MTNQVITLQLLYFAQLREHVDCEQETFKLAPPTTSSHLSQTESFSVAQLKAQLVQRSPQWQTAFANTVLCAVNQTLVNDEHLLHNNDEVAFFPPVTGG